METLCILDNDSRTRLSEDLRARINVLAEEKRIGIETIAPGKNDLYPCTGCLVCYKTSGQCVLKDGMVEINRKHGTSDVIVYLTPVVFGQFSSTIKNAIDRARPEGHKFHTQFIIGYGDDISDDEKNTFIDITVKRLITFPNKEEHIEVYVTRSVEDNLEIIRIIKETIEQWGSV